jgi:hypothetical protein
MYEVIFVPGIACEKLPEPIYEILCRCLPEILPFMEEREKEFYLALLKKYPECPS